jgi:hypothetical protein
MQYRVPLTGAPPRLDVVAEALQCADPAAVVDFDLVVDALRIATVLDEAALLDAVHAVGVEIRHGQVARLPSECCGGCGG